MINTEKAFDLLPYVVDIYEKLNIEKYIKDHRKKYKDKKGVDEIEVGIDMFKFIFRNSNKAKEEIFEVVAILDDKKVEEIKTQPLPQTLANLKIIFNDKELMSFFKSAMQ